MSIPLPAAPRARILIAEDCPINRRLATLLFEMHGCRVDAVADGLQAVAAFERGSYDLVVMNCRMPHLDGFAAARRLRRAERRLGRPRTPILACTAFALPGDRDACFRAGMDGCLLKPLRPGDLQGLLALLPGADAPRPLPALRLTTAPRTFGRDEAFGHGKAA